MWCRNYAKSVCYSVALARGRHFFMSETEKVCSCFGHSDVEITEELKARTRTAINDAINDGVRVFLFGGISDFDDLVYELVTESRADNPELGINRVFCFALDKQLRKPPHWFDRRKEYEALECPCKDFDYWYTSIYYRNCAIIDSSDLVLFYAEERENSGAFKALQYAIKKHKTFKNMFVDGLPHGTL